jgi:hypothetical protein
MAAACSTRSELGFATLMSEVPATRAIILPPPGGPAIVAVLQRTFLNGVSQEIALATASSTAGQNAFHVSLINDPVTQSEIDDTLTIPRLTQELVQKEMAERLPGIDMSTSLIYVQNKYGPFGFATGRTPSGDLCLYAWQRIETNEPAIFTPGGIVSIRLRLCDADATAEQLLRTMYGFTISAFFEAGAWNPYGSPPPVPAHLGQIDAPIFPPIPPQPESRVIVRRQYPAPALRPAIRPLAEPRQVVDKDTFFPSPPVPSPPPASDVTASSGEFPIVPPPP